MPPHITIESVGVTEAFVRMNARALRLADLGPELDRAADEVYLATSQWYDSDGGGTWPPLAAATVAGKTTRGSADPSRPLYDTGALHDSATSQSGPYSFKTHVDVNDVVIGVDWALSGWQIPVVHFYGTQTAGRGNATVIPGRPIWPAHASNEYREMRAKITELIFHGV